MTKRIYLDDLRSSPPGWIRTHTAEETIAALQGGDVVELSLDYDLGPSAGLTGAAVLEWIDRKIAADPSWTPPESILVHSGHRVGRGRLLTLLEGIRQRLKEKGRGGLVRGR